MMPQTVSTGDVFLRCFQVPSLLWELCMLKPGATSNDLMSVLSPSFPGQSIPNTVVDQLLADLANTGCRIWLQSLLEWVQAHPSPAPWPHMRAGGGLASPPWG